MPAISVIVAVGEVAGYLERCLDSVLGQDGIDSLIEVIAVDDGSRDGSGAILDARLDPRLSVIRLPASVGPGRARELGLKEARGEYVWFVDADDELAAGALAAVAAQLDRLQPDVLVIDYENSMPDGRITPSGANLDTPELTTLADSPVLMYITSSMWTKVVRRDFLDGLGLSFGPGIFEDVPVAVACLLAAPRIAVLNQVCYRYYRSRPGSFMAEVSDRHLDIFQSYETIYQYVADRPALDPAVSNALFIKTMRHYIPFALAKLPKSSRPAFFRQAAGDFRRWRPAEFTFLPGARGIELRLLSRGAYRTYAALTPLNRLRLALGSQPRLS